jgi:peptidoglycan/LPS O-acetylase OafA/YrhL
MLSLSYFNLRPEWNVWAIYFAGAYALGALAYSAGHLSKHRCVVGGIYLAGALMCAWFEPRPRLFVAMVTAVVLFGIQFISMDASFWTRLARKMGDSSYALFLSHFSILMLMSCIYPAVEAWDIPFVGWLWATFIACNAVAWLIWRYIDEPLQHHRQM